MLYSSRVIGLAGVVVSWLLCWIGPVRAEDYDYSLGHGLNVGDFNLAGYASVTADGPLGHRKDVSVDDLSLFVSGHVNDMFNPFMETELANLPILQTPEADGGLRGRAVLERLYNDILISDDITLRGGKMLAPVGEWNSIHAAPLVMTTSRPLATYYGFSEYVTGISMLYTNASLPLPEAQVYWQPAGEFAQRTPDLTVRNYRDVAGAHLNWPFGLTDKIGASVQHSTIESSGDHQFVGGVNGNYKIGPLSFESEATYSSIEKQPSESTHPTEWGGYVLGAYALSQEVSLFAWYEVFRTRYDITQSQDILLGASWHSSPWVVWKLEYVGSIGGPTDTNLTGFYGSLSVLF